MDVVGTSKRLSYVLRHAPGSVGLALDDAGWVDVGDLLAALDLTRADLDEGLVDAVPPEHLSVLDPR